MKNVIIICLLLFGSIGMYGQDPFYQEPTPEAEKTAKPLVREYSKELGLSGEQELLVQQKLVEFIMKKEGIRNSTKSAEDKLHFLNQLHQIETAEMANILTRPQLMKYKNIKPVLQPIKPVVVGQIESE